MRILLLDDHPFVHDVMRAVLNRALGPATIYSELELSTAIGRNRRRVDFAVVDLGLPGCSGISALAKLRSAYPAIPIVVLSAADDGATIRMAIEAGAQGYIPKTSTTKVMISALRLVASGGTYVPPQALRNNIEATFRPSFSGKPGVSLTVRQSEVLRQIVQGRPNRQIARELDISEHTVKQHASAIFQALGVSSRTEALIAARRCGIHID